MVWTQAKAAIVVSVGLLLAGGVPTLANAQTIGDNELTPQQIIKKSQAVYAALSSYSDDGKVNSTVGTTVAAPHAFTIKLARPNLYRIEWAQNMLFSNQKGAVWSAGKGDFLKLRDSIEKQADKEESLSDASGLSGRASASIPGTFFKMNRNNQFDASMQSATRKGDESVGEIACYVLTEEKGGRTRTLWIGKQDFLIHQVEDDASAKVMKATMEAAAKGHPDLQASLPYIVGDCKIIQTHLNIILNKSFSAGDFDYRASAGAEQ